MECVNIGKLDTYLETPGIEPEAFHMRSEHSTTELHPHRSFLHAPPLNTELKSPLVGPDVRVFKLHCQAQKLATVILNAAKLYGSYLQVCW